MPNLHSPALAAPERPAPDPAGRRAFGAEPGAREHDANGHYVHGPRLLPPPVVRLIAERVLGGVEIAAREKAPAAERRRMGREATRATHRGRERFLRALQGERAPVRRTRAA